MQLSTITVSSDPALAALLGLMAAPISPSAPVPPTGNAPTVPDFGEVIADAELLCETSSPRAAPLTTVPTGPTAIFQSELSSTAAVLMPTGPTTVGTTTAATRPAVTTTAVTTTEVTTTQVTVAESDASSRNDVGQRANSTPTSPRPARSPHPAATRPPGAVADEIGLAMAGTAVMPRAQCVPDGAADAPVDAVENDAPVMPQSEDVPRRLVKGGEAKVCSTPMTAAVTPQTVVVPNQRSEEPPTVECASAPAMMNAAPALPSGTGRATRTPSVHWSPAFRVASPAKMPAAEFQAVEDVRAEPMVEGAPTHAANLLQIRSTQPADVAYPTPLAPSFAAQQSLPPTNPAPLAPSFRAPQSLPPSAPIPPSRQPVLPIAVASDLGGAPSHSSDANFSTVPPKFITPAAAEPLPSGSWLAREPAVPAVVSEPVTPSVIHAEPMPAPMLAAPAARQAQAGSDSVPASPLPAARANTTAVFADGARGEILGEEVAPGAGVKKLLPVAGKQVTAKLPGLGIGIAQRAPSMHTAFPSSAIEAAAPRSAIEAVAGATIELPAAAAATELKPAAIVSEAGRAVAETLQGAERIDAREQPLLRFHFAIGGEQLLVKLEWHGGEVRTVFHTDSTELRAALTQEWHAVAAPQTEGGLRIADPVFTDGRGLAQDPARDGFDRQRRQPVRIEDEDTSWRPATGGASSSSAPRVAATARSRTSQHLHTQA